MADELLAFKPLKPFTCTRSAAGRTLDGGAVIGAVHASVRHTGTPDDELLMADVPRLEAREQVREKIDEVLTTWRQC